MTAAAAPLPDTTVPATEEHPSRADRARRGKAARWVAPRGGLAVWQPASGRADPVDILESQAASRVSELVPVRYGRMLASPFAFYRGAAAIMAADLAQSPTSGIIVQACGDAHLSNFGLFASPERSLMFDINDFDETLPGPWEWDVKRLAASLTVAGRHNGFSEGERRAAVLAAAAQYRTAMREFAQQGNLEVWYAAIRVRASVPRLRDTLGKKRAAMVANAVSKARKRDNTHALKRLTHLVDGQPRIISDPPLVVPFEELLPEVEAAQFNASMREVVESYRGTLAENRRRLLDQFEYRHIARKVVGVGSVGTRATIILLTGRGRGDSLLLQAKEAQASVLEPYVGASRHGQHGQRVVVGQRLMQAASDIFLGWTRTVGMDGVSRDYYVRQLRDWKGALDPEMMDPVMMRVYATWCAWTLARAHARSGDRVAIAAYLGSGSRFERAIADFSEAYADQNERDCAALERAARAGRITALSGV